MIACAIAKTVQDFFPDLWRRIDVDLKDPRTKQDYTLSEILGACILLFVFQIGSRNAFNEKRMENEFQANYYKLFGLRAPHMDTVNAVLSRLETSELERLKTSLLRTLLERKVFHKWRLDNHWFIVAVDGTGIHSFQQSTEGCVKKTRKVFEFTEAGLAQLSEHLSQASTESLESLKVLVGQTFNSKQAFATALKSRLGEAVFKQHQSVIYEHTSCRETSATYLRPVLEAKLLCANGFSISLATEWIENTETDYNKQDCELNAFKRLAEKLKSAFPRLPICMVVDGLYPNEPFFKICRNNHWEFACAFQDGSLSSVQTEVAALKKITRNNTRSESAYHPNGTRIDQAYTWLNDIEYRDSTLHWVECIETTHKLTADDTYQEDSSTRFVYLTSQRIHFKTVIAVVKAGRLRQKIENEGFNTQKNLGYNLEHKYARNSALGSKNYYQCLQIGHMINQLVMLASVMQQQFKDWGTTWKHCWDTLRAFLIESRVNADELATLLRQSVQYRYLS